MDCQGFFFVKAIIHPEIPEQRPAFSISFDIKTRSSASPHALDISFVCSSVDQLRPRSAVRSQRLSSTLCWSTPAGGTRPEGPGASPSTAPEAAGGRHGSKPGENVLRAAESPAGRPGKGQGGLDCGSKHHVTGGKSLMDVSLLFPIQSRSEMFLKTGRQKKWENGRPRASSVNPCDRREFDRPVGKRLAERVPKTDLCRCRLVPVDLPLQVQSGQVN